VAVDTIINQKGQNIVLLLRRDRPEAVDRSARVVDKLNQFGAMEYTTVVAANASEPRAAAVPRPVLPA